MRTHTTSLSIAGLTLLLSLPSLSTAYAQIACTGADDSCPGSSSSWHRLEPYGNPDLSGGDTIYFGTVLLGTPDIPIFSSLAFCINGTAYTAWDDWTGGYGPTYLTAPSFFCTDSGSDDVYILRNAYTSPVYCGATRMFAPNYNNKRLGVYSQGGNDVVEGGNGNDFVCGGTGDDIIDGGDGDDNLDGWKDNDHVRGWGGMDNLYGYLGNDYIHDSSGAYDSLTGEGGYDCVNDADASFVSCACGGSGPNDRSPDTYCTGCYSTSESCL